MRKLQGTWPAPKRERKTSDIHLVITHRAGWAGEDTTAEELAGKLMPTGWSKLGLPYHFVIEGDGTVVEMAGIGLVTNHCYGFNGNSVGVAIVGDFREEEPTEAQRTARQDLILYLSDKLGRSLKDWTHDEARQRLGQPPKGCPGSLFNP